MSLKIDNLRSWDEVLLESLKDPQEAFALLESYTEDAQVGEMYDILSKVITANPTLIPVVIPMYAKYLTLLELETLQLTQAAEFIRQYKPYLSYVLAS